MMNQESKEDSDAENSVKVILQHTSGWDPERKMKKAHDLFEESIRFHCGRNGRKIDKISSRKLAMQASALGHRSALAECYYRGWGGCREGKKRKLLRNNMLLCNSRSFLFVACSLFYSFQ
mmetsp:Transcript_13968/g.19586  ORF Transcript_13968/g.19586 Transcript_13968/m.19586 type:complete len:120 (+) Transcript_13968:688-1047(+)